MKVALIFVGGTPKQNDYWWPSYTQCVPGYEHDIILVHRNMYGVPSDLPASVVLENKIFSTGELPHKAFGAYKHYFMKYFSKYDIFGFISDDVYLRRDNWIKDVVDMFETYPKLGIVSPLLCNNPPHVRAPIWFGRKECLMNMNWGFNDDHDGEMTNADRCVSAGFFVAQIGHKIDFAYDPDWNGYANPRVCGSPQPNQWIEKIWFGEDHFNSKFSPDEIKSLDVYKRKLFCDDTSECISDLRINSNSNEQQWNVCFEIQPYHGLIYNKGINIVQKNHELDIYDKEVNAGYVNPETNTFFGPNNGRYICEGINKFNPIAILK